jgi:hypothetical protein
LEVSSMSEVDEELRAELLRRADLDQQVRSRPGEQWPDDQLRRAREADVASYFPGPVVTLRTLKSDVIADIDPTALDNLDATEKAWRIDGSHGLVQLHPR